MGGLAVRVGSHAAWRMTTPRLRPRLRQCRARRAPEPRPLRWISSSTIRANRTRLEMITEDDDDFLNAARRERGALPAGEYVAEIVPGSVVPFATPQTVGCTVGVKICAGDYCDRVIRLRFLEDGAPSLDGLIARD